MTQRDRQAFDEHLRSWLAAHPPPEDHAFEVELAQRVADAIDPVDLDPDRPYTDGCFRTPDSFCENHQRCVTCPAYCDWKAKVRAPFEIGG